MDSVEAQIDSIIQQSSKDITSTPTLTNEISPIEQSANTTTNPKISSGMDENENIEVFNTALHQYLRIDEEIKSLLAAIKERNEIKRKLAESLSNFLRTNQIKKVNLDGSYKGKRLEVNVKVSNSGFNKERVTEAILNEFQEQQELFDKIMQVISKTNITKEAWKLKIVEEKKKRNKSSFRKHPDSGLSQLANMIDND